MVSNITIGNLEGKVVLTIILQVFCEFVQYVKETIFVNSTSKCVMYLYIFIFSIFLNPKH